MRFLVDESTGPAVARRLRELGHETYSVFEQSRGMDDDDVIHKAATEGWILITNDKGFGERVFRLGVAHRGVVLLRLADERAPNKVAVIERLLSQYESELPDAFVVATERTVRILRT